MRTDSVNLSKQALDQAGNFIHSEFGKEYHKKRSYTTKSAGAQEAHEAIRPTDLTRNPDSLTNILDSGQLKLYTLIWKRTLASQMSDAKVEITTYTLTPESAPSQSWIAKGEVITFDGFMKLYIEGNDDEESEQKSGMLAKIEKNTCLEGKNLLGSQLFSRPPARYTEASLVKKLESE